MFLAANVKGGVTIWNAFLSDLNEKLETQSRAINILTKKQLINIAKNWMMDALGSFALGKPKSYLIGYGTGGADFAAATNISIISPSVAKKVHCIQNITIYHTQQMQR
jgi:hypothetical protein